MYQLVQFYTRRAMITETSQNTYIMETASSSRDALQCEAWNHKNILRFIYKNPMRDSKPVTCEYEAAVLTTTSLVSEDVGCGKGKVRIVPVFK
jgi:hypothetical protein